jgi:hypothetical protein
MLGIGQKSRVSDRPSLRAPLLPTVVSPVSNGETNPEPPLEEMSELVGAPTVNAGRHSDLFLVSRQTRPLSPLTGRTVRIASPVMSQVERQ